MTDPITLIDDQSIKLTFEFFLCIKQIAWLFGLLVIYGAVIYKWDNPDAEEEESETSSSIPQRTPMNERQIFYMNYIEERKQKLALARAEERERKIKDALENRKVNNKKTCSQCGGSFGTGSACQYCGQES